MKNLKLLVGLLVVVLIASDAALFLLHFSEKNELEKLKNEVVELQQLTSPFNQTPQQFSAPKEEAFGETTTISFDKKEYDFGTIKTDSVYSTEFFVTNTGKENLIISKAVGSCGCTVPEWSEEPIKTGEKSIIKVNFDAHSRLGEQVKTVTITANTVPNQTVFTIKAKVVK